MNEEISEDVWEYSGWGFDRLSAQSRLFEPLTERFLLEAGVRPGMRVLDVGAGQGDVSLLAARIVGPQGRVVAMDRSESCVWTIRCRAMELGLSHVHALQGDFTEERFNVPFDAIVGRFALMNTPEVSAVIWRLAAHLGARGIIAFQELDFGGARTIPASPTFDRAMSWVTRTLAKVGVHTRLGLELRRHFLDAGLPDPSLRIEENIGGGPGYPGYMLLGEVLQSLLPTMKRLGVARPEEVDVTTLVQLLHDEVGAYGGVMVLPSLVSAWTTLP
ncbi:class I SAM-dependent methyltransferase [Melittangium boletus]|nr:methyltransferase domain-containing protein [Melittangium boletus]